MVAAEVLRCEQVLPLLEEILQPSPRPPFSRQALENVHLGPHEAAAGVDNPAARVLAVPQQRPRVVRVERREPVQLIGELDEVRPEAAHVPLALPVQLHPFLLETLNLPALRLHPLLVRLLLVVDERLPLVQLVQQRHLEGPVHRLGQDLLVVGDQVLHPGGRHEHVGRAGALSREAGRHVAGAHRGDRLGAGLLEAGACFQCAAEGGCRCGQGSEGEPVGFGGGDEVGVGFLGALEVGLGEYGVGRSRRRRQREAKLRQRIGG